MRKDALGVIGEQIAHDHLVRSSYSVLDRNWRYLKFELDLVCTFQNRLIVVEVKTRETGKFGEPWTFLTKGQCRNIIKAANAYVVQHALDLHVQFDVVSVIHNQHRTTVEHLPNAFFPTL